MLGQMIFKNHNYEFHYLHVVKYINNVANE